MSNNLPNTSDTDAEYKTIFKCPSGSIGYNKASKKFSLSDDAHTIYFTLEEFDKKLKKHQKRATKHRLKNSPDIITEELSPGDILERGYWGAYDPKENIISLLKLKGLSTEGEKLFSDIMEKTLRHELSHYEDDKNGFFITAGITPELRAKLDFLSEIKANIKEISFDIKKGKTKLETPNCGRLTELEEYIRDNPNAPDINQQIARTVFNRWLQINNTPESLYNEQAYQNATSTESGRYNTIDLLSKTPNHEKEFLKRFNQMFKNVEDLGDIREYINPNFELNTELQQKLSNETPHITQTSNTKGIKLLRKILAKTKKALDKLDPQAEEKPASHQTSKHLKQLMQKIQKMRGTHPQTTNNKSTPHPSQPLPKNNTYNHTR